MKPMAMGSSELGTLAYLEKDLDTLAGARRLERRRPSQVVLVLIIVLLLAMAAHLVVSDAAFQWGVVGKYIVSSSVLHGVLVTILLTFSSMATGCVIGLIVAFLGMSDNRILKCTAVTYIWGFRGIPALVQILFWYNLAALMSHVSLGVPFGPELWSISSNNLITAYSAAVLGLGLCEAAYIAEIIRGGIQGVPRGQFDAAKSLGLSWANTMRYAILPQTLKIIVPPMGNQLIGMLKYTSLASVVATTELLESVELIYGRNFEVIPLLMVATLWYLALTVVLTFGQRLLERRFAREDAQQKKGRYGLATSADLYSSASTVGI
jgi:polar amino acid transport system permease protein